MTFALQPHRMGILHVHAAATAHELQDIDLVTQALEWLTETDWNVDMTTSYHGLQSSNAFHTDQEKQAT